MIPEGIAVNDIPEQGSRGFDYQGQKYFVIKKRGKYHVYINSCPHIGIPLEWVENQFLDASSSMIQCANHGALFVIETGDCVAGPCSGQKLVSVPFDIIDGWLQPR